MQNIIIIGAGSTGAVIASRVSEDPNRRVPLIEAGPDYPDFSTKKWTPLILTITLTPTTTGVSITRQQAAEAFFRCVSPLPITEQIIHFPQQIWSL